MMQISQYKNIKRHGNKFNRIIRLRRHLKSLKISQRLRERELFKNTPIIGDKQKKKRNCKKTTMINNCLIIMRKLKKILKKYKA